MSPLETAYIIARFMAFKVKSLENLCIALSSLSGVRHQAEERKAPSVHRTLRMELYKTLILQVLEVVI